MVECKDTLGSTIPLFIYNYKKSNKLETIGNSFKTMLSRMANIKAKNLVDPETGEALNDVETTLNGLGIALRDSKGSWRNFGDVIDEVADKWKNYSDTQKSALATAFAGTRQKEVFTTLMENYENVGKYAETAFGSAGLAVEKYGIYTDSVAGKQETLNAKFEEFYTNILNGGLIKSLLDAGNALMSFINLGDGLVGKIMLITATTTAWIIALNALKKSGVTGFTTLIAKILGVDVATKGATASAVALNTVLNAMKAHPVIFAISALTTAFTIGSTAIKKYNEHIQETIDKANEATESYKTTQKEIENEIKTLTSSSGEYKTLQDEFDKLCQGVDQYGNNISLTNAEYERYKSICEQLVKDNPDLIKGYDSATEAINNQSGALKTTIDYLKEKARLEAQEYADNSKETAKGYKNQYDKETKDARIDTDTAKKFVTTGWNDFKNIVSETIGALAEQGLYEGKVQNSLESIFTEFLSFEGKDADTILQNWDKFIENIENKKKEIDKISTLSDSQKKAIKQSLDDFITNLGISDVAKRYNDAIKPLNDAKDKFNDSIQSIYDSVLNASEIYGNSDSNTKHYLKEWIINSGMFDIDPNDPDYNSEIDKAKDSISKMLSKIGKLSDSQKQQMSKALGEAFKIDDLIINLDDSEFQTKIRKIISTISKITGQAFDEVATSLNLDMYLNITTVGYKELQGVYNQTKLLAQAQNELNNSGKVSESTINSMQGAFSNLQSYLTKTKDGYALTQKGLEALTGSMQTQYKVALNEARNGALSVLDQEHKKGLSYQSTTKAIKEQLEAQLALAKANYAKLGIGGGGLHTYKPYTETLKALQELERADAQYTASKISLSGAGSGGSTTNTGGYTSSGSGSSSNKSSGKSPTETAMEKLKKQLDRGEISIDWYIKSLEKLQKGLNTTSEDYKELASTIKKAKLDKINADFDRGAISVDYYITLLTDLRKGYAKTTENYKDLTKAINDAKLDKINSDFDRGIISIDWYITQLTELRNIYAKTTEDYKDLTKTINDTKLDKYSDMYDRKQISADEYIKQIQAIQKEYAKTSEEYLKLADKIDDIKLEKTQKLLDSFDKKVEDIDNKINQLGDVNTDTEQVKYAQLLADKYKQVQANIVNIRKELANSNLTAEQRNELQDKLNEYLEEEVSLRDEIESKVREYYENQKSVEEKQAELNKKQTLYNKEVQIYGKQGKELYEYYADKELEALEKKKEALDGNNKRQELENDLLEAKLRLQNALNNKTTKILKKQADGTWQYEYSANMQDVQKANEDIKDAQKALNEYDIQEKIDKINTDKDNKAKEYADAEFWANREYEQAMNDIGLKYGDIDKLVEQWMNNNSSNTTQLVTSYQSLVVSNNSLANKLVDLETAIDAKYETVDTKVGTGYIPSTGQLGTLTETTNNYIKDIISQISKILDNIDIGKISISSYIEELRNLKDSILKSNSTTISNVECVFPNITTVEGLQEAILALPRLALQKK